MRPRDWDVRNKVSLCRRLSARQRRTLKYFEQIEVPSPSDWQAQEASVDISRCGGRFDGDSMPPYEVEAADFPRDLARFWYRVVSGICVGRLSEDRAPSAVLSFFASNGRGRPKRLDALVRSLSKEELSEDLPVRPDQARRSRPLSKYLSSRPPRQ